MTIEFETLSLILAQQGVLNSAAEVNGMVCGQLCSGALPYSAELTGKILSLESLPIQFKEYFDEMAGEIQNQVEGDNFDFSPLLPDDDEELTLRLHALGRWCDGFNLGFAAGYSATGQVILDEVKEVLTDFARIAEIDEDQQPHQDDEGAESDYMEVVEYLRVAAVSVYMQHNMQAENDEKQPDSLNQDPVQIH